MLQRLVVTSLDVEIVVEDVGDVWDPHGRCWGQQVRFTSEEKHGEKAT